MADNGGYSESDLVAHVTGGDRKAMKRLYDRYVEYLSAVCARYIADDDSRKDVLSLRFLKKNSAYGFIEYEDRLPDMVDEPEPEGIPDDVLNDMVLSLPPGYRMVFNLYVFERKSHKEIAAMLGIGESSSASQFSRAKALLARRMKDYKNKLDNGLTPGTGSGVGRDGVGDYSAGRSVESTVRSRPKSVKDIARAVSVACSSLFGVSAFKICVSWNNNG